MKTTLLAALRRLLGLALFGAMTVPLWAIQVSTSSTNIFVDLGATPPISCMYTMITVTNNDGVARSNLWVTLGSFTNGLVKLGGNDAGQYNLGSLAVNESKPASFYLQATNGSGTSQFTVQVYQGLPGVGTLLTNRSFQVTVTTVANGANNKVTACSYSPAQPVLGGVVTVSVVGTTAPLATGRLMTFTPATSTNWSANAFRLEASSISNSAASTTYSNTLFFMQAGSSKVDWTATYSFRAMAVTTSSNTPSPDGAFATGGPSTIEHSSASVTLPPIIPPTNSVVLTNFASVTARYTNEIIFFTNRFSNASSNDVWIDRVVDTLPVNFVYVSNSSTFDGASIANPSASGATNTWSVPLNVTAGTSRDLVFQAYSTGTNTFVTNSVIAYIGTEVIDQTINTANSTPATSTVRILWAPSAINDVGSVSEDAVLTVSAPGVLGNDDEPNGFTKTVLSYTSPANGSLTLNANGSYTYTPNGNFNGSDSFTYTMTNGNARASTATVNLTINAVNDAPTLNAISNLTINEDAVATNIALSGISPGLPANESSQTVTNIFALSSDTSIVPNPVVAYTGGNATGTLTLTPVANANGTVTISVIAQDNGGIANGGVAAVTNTFVVTVNAVNDAPNFTKGGNQNILDNAGTVTITGWATSISAGPANESAQALNFIVTNSNNALFVTQPAINASGTLTFAPATNANGTAIVSVKLHDNGGTSNSGVDTSAEQTFTIQVTPVNDPPTLNALSNLTIREDAGSTNIALTGISAGPAESGVLTVTATSSNPSVISNPLVSYTSPATSGQLTLAPVSGGIGQSTITVIVSDDGGRANGGIDAVTNQFTVTVLGVTNTWVANDSRSLNITNASGTGGNGYSLISYAGVLNITATSGSPVTISLSSFNGASAGAAANFNNDNTNTWTIATATRGITGFAANKFIFNDASFSNDLAGGTFSIALSGDSKSLNVIFTPNHAPVANAVSYARAWGTSLKINLSQLIAAATSDSDGDARSVVWAGGSTNFAFVRTNSTYILFAPTNNIGESFSYAVRDQRSYRAGDTVRMATNFITVSVTNAVSSAQSILSIGGTLTMVFAGVPGYSYDVERASSLAGPWSAVLTTNAPATGVWIYQDTNPPVPAAYYRTKQHNP